MLREVLQILVLCFIAALWCGSAEAAGDADGRIVNGQIIDVSQALFAVQLRRDGASYCGGTLIGLSHVLTAAHCVDSDAENVKIVAAANTIFDKGIERGIAKLLIPSEYSRKTVYRDLAIIKLDAPFDGSTVKTLPLCSKPWSPGSRLQVFGWGKLTEGGRRSRNLRTIDIPMITQDECLSKNDLSVMDDDSRQCAFESGSDACQGDSGGPALMGGELCGVISAGAGCADDRYPGLYTSVYTMRGYITKAMETM